MKTEKENITRHDYEKNHGYVVRYMRDKCHFQKLFSDGVYGSPEKAYEAAELYLTELKSAFPPMNRREYCQIKRRKNSSGVVGVSRSSSKGYVCWVARWSPREGEVTTRRFSVKLHGEERAKQLAIEAREAGLREMELEWSENRGSTGNRYNGENQHHDSPNTPIIRDIYAFEGEPIYRIHLDRERDKELREAAIENYKARYGKIRCEICKFSFEETYGEMGKDLIEVHHVVPLGSREGNTMTKVDELMLICANCHLVIHAGNADENLRRLKILFSGEDFAKRTKSANKSAMKEAVKRRTVSSRQFCFTAAGGQSSPDGVSSLAD